jgi:hypothetical protein
MRPIGDHVCVPRERVNVGDLDLGPLQRMWEVSDRLAEQVDGLESGGDPRALTARRFDEAQPAGNRTYIAARGYLDSAFEHDEALRALLLAHGATPRAPWTLMRSIYEAGAWATWALDPANGLERRRRGLRLEVWSFKQRKAFHAEFKRTADEQAKLDAGDRKTERTYRAEAKALGMEWALAGSRPNLADEIPKLSDVRSGPADLVRPMVGVWRSLSGMQHGLPYALLAMSDHSLEVEMPGGQSVQVSIKDDTFHSFATISYLMTIFGALSYCRRSTAP